MKRIAFLFFIILLTTFSVFSKDNNSIIITEWTMDNYSITQVGDSKKLVCKFNYKIKNKTSQTLFFYDIEWGNDLQNDVIKKSSNSIFIRTYIFYGFDGWMGSWGYSPRYPRFHEIHPENVLTGVRSIEFPLDETTDIKKLSYKFNYIIANKNYAENCISTIDSNIADGICQNYYVEFSLNDKEKKYEEIW